MQLLERLVDLLLEVSVVLRHRNAVVLGRELVLEGLHTDRLCLLDVVVVNGTVVDDSIHAARLELHEAVCGRVQLSDRNALHLLDHVRTRRTDLNGDLMPLQILERLDRLLIAADDHRKPRLIVRIGEIHLLFALIVDRHAADDDIDVLRLQRRDQAIKSDVLDLRLAAHLLCDRTDEIHVEALILLLPLILELEGCEVHRSTDTEHLGLLLRLIAAAAADKRETHESTGQNKCQFFQFHRKASSNEIKSKEGRHTRQQSLP